MNHPEDVEDADTRDYITYTTICWGESHKMRANFAQASSPILFYDDEGAWSGRGVHGKQVADFGHRPDDAMGYYLHELAEASGEDPYEDSFICSDIEAAIKLMLKGTAS